ncbi:MAG: glutamate mutase L [Synergistaceae bacterium]|nr:glutamate mutase L [Synergistaceae bacterium]
MSHSGKAILLDFGSTHTKITVADTDEEEILFSGAVPSTVKSDARVGLLRCLEMAEREIGEELDGAVKLASSSAAGGLRMAVIGLSKSLSVSAGRNSACGAGGRILCTLAGKITAQELEPLSDAKVEIILFCGGYENGNEKAVRHNARVIAASRLRIPVIYAGNSAVAGEVRALLTSAGKECFIADNIIPAVGELNGAMAEETVREIFLKRIINMKGLEGVREMLDGILMPTPAAVLEAGRLLSEGCDGEEGIGELMIFDVGGATTDVHSFAEQSSCDGARIAGAAESRAKRTVEGDLGLRESASQMAETAGFDRLAAEAAIAEEKLREAVALRSADTSFIPEKSEDKAIDAALAAFAVKTAARRHAGYLEHIASANCKLLQRGKNLSGVKTIIAAGGPLIKAERPEKILAKALKTEGEEDILLPRSAELFTDKSYIFYAMGLLSQSHPRQALSIMKKYLRKEG